MKTHDTYRLLITPLSPVHLGTGESYEPTNYVIDDGCLHEFDTGAVIDALSVGDRKALLDIGGRRPDAEMIKALQRFFFERRDVLMAHAVQRVPVLPGVASLYAKSVGQTVNREADGGKVVNRLEIDRTAFDPVSRQPVLYGSSIKGAIRTALLDLINGGSALRRVEDRHTGRQRHENNLELQQRLFQYRAGKFELDPMRLVQLADAPWRGEPGLPAAQVRLAVNRKKAPVVDQQGRLRKSQAEAKELYQILECVQGWHCRGFAGQMNLQSVAGIVEQDRGGRRRLPATDLRFDGVTIAKACNDFYLPILKAELNLLRERGYLDADWERGIQATLQESEDRRIRGEAFFVRIGRHSGAEAVTLNGVRSIKIIKGSGEKPEYLDGAKTFWLAADEKDQTNALLPFGWVLIELQSCDAPLREWPELKALCEPLSATARVWAKRLAEKQAELENVKRATETRRQQEEEAMRRAAEIEAKRQREGAEREARRAAMSENMRRVEAFKEEFAARAEQLRGGKEKPNAAYHDRARKLAKEALEGAGWTAEERRAAAGAIEEWLPKVVQVDLKDERKKLRLAALKEQA
jgi:CRISPR-associated protein Csm5